MNQAQQPRRARSVDIAALVETVTAWAPVRSSRFGRWQAGLGNLYGLGELATEDPQSPRCLLEGKPSLSIAPVLPVDALDMEVPLRVPLTLHEYTSDAGERMGQVFVEDWAAAYGSPYLTLPDDNASAGILVEDGDAFAAHSPDPAKALTRPIAFVDGVRRGDASLYQEDPATGLLARGIAGSHACGAVIVEPGERPVCSREQISRMVIWGSGLTGALPAQPGGWAWQSASVDSNEPDAPLIELQQRMRKAEGRLAEDSVRGRVPDRRGRTA